MTTELKKLDETLGARIIRSMYNESTVHDTVDSWNWNMNIFEIYDEIKDWTQSDQRNVLRYSYRYFNSDVMINEMASHLTGEGVA